MWAHWTAQCVPEQGDWYARRMYIQGEKDYDYHVKTYGHYRLPRRDAMFRGHGIRPGQAAMRIISDHLFPADLGAKQLAFWNQLGQFVLRICKFLYLLFSSNR